MKLTQITNPMDAKVNIADQTVYLTAAQAGKPLKSDSSGNLRLSEASITLLEHLVNKKYVDSKVPSGLELRVDTTVGTRIFAGNTMIHGDTGWRNISASLQSGWTGTLLIKRSGGEVMVRGLDMSPTNATGVNLVELPTGFQGINRHPIPAYSLASAPVYCRVINYLIQLDRTTGSNVARDLTGSFPTSQAWPVTLPGIPA
ncbi:MAG: hypothetical protein Q4F10_06165 [Corynebacterium glutamicum]|nr:hypothetical protein [Corynebacterium glutamicum]